MASVRWAFAFAFVLAFAGASVAAARADVALGPGAIGASVRDVNDRAVAGASVTVDGPTLREATTSSGGVATLDALPLGTYTMRVTGAGFAPYVTRVDLATTGRSIALLAVRVRPTTFADLRDAAAFADVASLSDEVDPFVAHVVERGVATNVVATASGAAIASAGGDAGDARIELDGIPLAGGAGSLATLRARDGLGFDEVEVVRGPALASLAPAGAIGGIVDYRTPDTSASSSVGGALGYDTSLGSFENFRGIEHVGRLGVVADVTESQTLRSRTVKAALDVTRGLAIAIARYGATALLTSGNDVTIVDAPAFALDARAAIGRTTLTARTYASASTIDRQSTYATLVKVGRSFAARPANTRIEDARAHGLQFAYTIPLGDNVVLLGYDRREDARARADATAFDLTTTTLSVHADVRLSDAARAQFGDAYGRSARLASRHQPFAALAVRVDPRATLRLSVGSAFATAPDFARDRALLASDAGRVETALGTRLELDEALAAGGRAWFAIDDVRRFDRFTGPRTTSAFGLEAGYERSPLPARFDGELAVRYERAADVLGTPTYKARVALGYSDATAAAGFGLTALGVRNALASHAIALGDVHVRVRFSQAVDLRLGIDNLFGYVVTNPQLVPLFAPREITFTLGPARDAR